MRLNRVVGALLLAGLLAPALAAGEGAAVKWMSDFEAAKKVAVEQKKNLFVEFTAEW